MAESMSQSAINAGINDARQQVRHAAAEVEAQIAAHWVWYLILGIALPAVGVVTLAALPFIKGAVLGALSGIDRSGKARAKG